jgi:hypothetical protein
MGEFNYKEFFENIKLDENGNIIAVLQDGTSVNFEKGISQYNTYKEIKLTNEGYLVITTN